VTARKRRLEDLNDSCYMLAGIMSALGVSEKTMS
jgi:hypothetical protein